MGAISSQITSVSMVCSTVFSNADQRKHQSSASLAFVRGIHRWPVNSPHKGPVTRKLFPFDDVIMLNPVCVRASQLRFFRRTRNIKYPHYSSCVESISIISQAQPVAALGYIEITLDSYVNRQGTTYDKVCCDKWFGKCVSNGCDHRFTICLHGNMYGYVLRLQYLTLRPKQNGWNLPNDVLTGLSWMKMFEFS